jgi:penicillin-binding protein 1A
MGLTPDLVTGVWVGGDDRTIRFRATSLGQGANLALPIWALYMKKVYNDNQLQLTRGDFERPEGLKEDYFNCTTFDENNNSGSATEEQDKY